MVMHTARTAKQIIEVFLPNQACPGSRLQDQQLSGLAEKNLRIGLGLAKLKLKN
jgi:hypothetical protein